MNYRRMPIEVESPEQLGYQNIDCNLTESSVSDVRIADLGLGLDLDRLVLAYGDHLGKAELRERIAGEGGLQPDDVLVTAGAAAALFIVSTSLLEKGDRLVVMKPNYATNIETPRALGAEVVFLPLTFEQGYGVDFDLLASLITPATKLVSITVPHNPTGAMMTLAELRRAIALVENSNAYILIDETYRELAFGEPLPPAASLSERVISVSSLSKAYGLPGIRIGWLQCRDRGLMEKFLAAKEQIFICNSLVDEEIACAVVGKKQELLAAFRARSMANLEIVRSWMAGQELLEWVEPKGGVVCFPRFRESVAIDIDGFYETLGSRYRTQVGPGHWFEESRRSMRIGYGWPGAAELAKGLGNIVAAAAAAR